MADEIIGFDKIVSDVSSIIISGRDFAYNATNAAMVKTYWQIGKRIVEEEQAGKAHAEYGKQLIRRLSSELTVAFGKGFSERNLRNIRAFYLKFPNEAIWQMCLPNPDHQQRHIARYSVLHDNDHLFMTKYLTYLPTKEKLKEEIEKQKIVFRLQHPDEQGGEMV